MRRWWLIAIAAGVVLAVASVADRFVPVMFIGLGLVGIGLGEAFNHSPQTRFGASHKGAPGYTRSNKPIGLLLDIVGTCLLCVGLYPLL
jgi:hypothetical protein